MTRQQRPDWVLTNLPLEHRFKIWERMGLGETNSAIEVWADQELRHYDRGTIAKVRRELESLPVNMARELPAAAKQFWKDLHPGEVLDESGSVTADSSAFAFSEARRKHTEDLLAIAAEWKEQLVVDLGDPITPRNTLVPLLFPPVAGAPGYGNKWPLAWQVDHEGKVHVWFSIEAEKQLLVSLLVEHLPTKAMDAYQALQRELEAAIEQAGKLYNSKLHNRGVRIGRGLDLVFRLADALEEILATRLLEGSCRVCRKYH